MYIGTYVTIERLMKKVRTTLESEVQAIITCGPRLSYVKEHLRDSSYFCVHIFSFAQLRIPRAVSVSIPSALNNSSCHGLFMRAAF
jgi:hypothetical protein